MMEKKEDIKELKINPLTQTTWSDYIELSSRNDGACLLRFAANLPEGLVEQSRLMIDKKYLIEFIDSACSILNHYPVKPTQQKKAKKD